MVKSERLDVTQIEPRRKHPTIFEYFDALDAGEAFIIDNDHDPKPLYYELLGERGNIFIWEYLEQGPEWWRVRIAKREKHNGHEDTIGQIAAKDLRKAQILKEKGIDFSCGGQKTLKEAAEEVHMSEDDLKDALEDNTIRPGFPPSHDYNQWPVNFLIEYITEVHHRYAKENSTILPDLILKVATRHGDKYPELKKLAYAARLFFNDIQAHMEKEENILFPAIRSADKRDASKYQDISREDIQSAILMLEKEHHITIEDLTYFRNLTDNYRLPEDACNSWTYLYNKMREFEEDWKHHVHIENNILFSKVLEEPEE